MSERKRSGRDSGETGPVQTDANSAEPASDPTAEAAESSPATRADSSPGGVPSLIVGVGASAGGLDAFREFLSAAPADAGIACVLIQHLDPSHRTQAAQ